MSSFKRLSPRSLRILLAFTEVVLGPALQKWSFPKKEYLETVQVCFGYYSWGVRFLMTLSLWIFEWGAFLFASGRFYFLSRDLQKSYYLAWHKSRFVLAYFVTKPLVALVQSTYYSLPKVVAAFDYDEPTRLNSSRKKYPTGILAIPDHDLEIETEICVVGSGAGGAVVAKELAEKGHQVLILEEGGYFDVQDFQIMSSYARRMHMYRDAGFFATLGAPPVLIPTGACVGGTTVINCGTCFRTPDAVLQLWKEEYGLSSLDLKKLNHVFEKVEKTIHVQPSPDRVLGKNNELVRDMLEKMGLHGMPLQRNIKDCKGSGICYMGCPTGAKQSMEQSYLPMAFEKGATLYPHCRVHKLHVKNGTVEKIEAFFIDPKTKERKSRLWITPKKVILSCGTLNTPLVLQRSGIGWRSGQLGKNLTVHPNGKVLALFDRVINAHKGIPQGFSITDYAKDGIKFETISFPPWVYASNFHLPPDKHFEVMTNYHKMAVNAFLVHDTSVGRVMEGPDGGPLAFYMMRPEEKNKLVEGAKILGRLFFEAGAKEIYTTLKTHPVIYSREELEKIDPDKIKRRDIECTAFHPLGTCRMGSDPHHSVVNEQMRVHDVENLWVADGSIFPTSLGVNPQITIMTFATLCAEAIHGSIED